MLVVFFLINMEYKILYVSYDFWILDWMKVVFLKMKWNVVFFMDWFFYKSRIFIYLVYRFLFVLCFY